MATPAHRPEGAGAVRDPHPTPMGTPRGGDGVRGGVRPRPLDTCEKSRTHPAFDIRSGANPLTDNENDDAGMSGRDRG